MSELIDGICDIVSTLMDRNILESLGPIKPRQSLSDYENDVRNGLLDCLRIDEIKTIAKVHEIKISG